MLHDIRLQHGIRISQIAIKARLSRMTIERAEKGKYISRISAQLIASAISALAEKEYSVEDLGIKVR